MMEDLWLALLPPGLLFLALAVLCESQVHMLLSDLQLLLSGLLRDDFKNSLNSILHFKFHSEDVLKGDSLNVLSHYFEQTISVANPDHFSASQISSDSHSGVSLTTIYVWEPKYNSSILALLIGWLKFEKSEEKDIGHVALQIGDTYVSVYPKDGFFYTPQDHKYTCYADEVKGLGGEEASYKETVNWLNTDSMLAAWERMQSEPYTLSISSCAGVSKNLLLRGVNLSRVAQDNYPDSVAFFENVKTFEDMKKKYPKSNFFDDLMEQCVVSDFSVKLEGIGIWIKSIIMIPFSIFDPERGVEIYAAPKEIIWIVKALKYYETGKYITVSQALKNYEALCAEALKGVKTGKYKTLSQALRKETRNYYFTTPQLEYLKEKSPQIFKDMNSRLLEKLALISRNAN
jgi:hypothetical protein